MDSSKSLQNIRVLVRRWIKEGEAALHVACFSRADLPSWDFALMVLSGTQLATLVLSAIGTGGFIGYVHGRFLLFAFTPFIFASIIHYILKRSAANKQWRIGEFVRVLSCASMANILLPLFAVLSWLHIAFFDFTNLIVTLTTGSALMHSFLYLRNRILLEKWKTIGIVVGAFLATSFLIWSLHTLLFPNPWAYLSDFLPSRTQ